MGFFSWKKNKTSDKKKSSSHDRDNWDLKKMFGANNSFAVSEAYNLLRTNIMFSFSSESSCHVIGITSSVRGEGKSTTSSNLAYALSETGKKTLLLEADLRLPSLAKKLELNRGPGLVNLLAERSDFRTCIQNSPLAPKLDILTSGATTPNPSELLGSVRMAEIVNELSDVYDYIIIDLPPITAVTDALVMSKLLHGIVMVVRNGAIEQRALADSMRQLKLIGVRILGFVYRGSEDPSVRYRRKYGNRYKKYYNYYRRPVHHSEKKRSK